MQHLKENNETYLGHMMFAGKIGFSLLFRGIVFLLHAVFPICSIPKNLNLAATSDKLDAWDAYTRERKDRR